MRRLILCLLAFPAILAAQTPAQTSAQPPPQTPLTVSLPPTGQSSQPQEPTGTPSLTLKTTTQLIVVDVTVQDKNGNPVHGLKASDFKLSERKVDQPIKSFEEHTVTAPPHPVKMPTLPPGTFTNLSPAPEGAPLNVILLDLLNTPLTDQSYVLDQLKKFVRRPSPPSSMAIFGLNADLTVLQGFTSDPAVLKYAVDHKIKLGASELLDDASGAGLTNLSAASALSGAIGGMSTGSAVANMTQFESDQSNFETQYRVRATLDAFNSIARFLSKFPGRKNLIWFSGSFPLAIFPDENIEDPFTSARDNAEDLRVTTNLLDRARVAVYPIDARGLRTLPTFDAAGGNMANVSATATTHTVASAADAVNSFASSNAQEHITMTQMAEDTGGRAFFNLNNLADAVTRAVTDGANYYTLTYSPANHKYNGEFRSIKVTVNAPDNAGNLKLSYRHGYFADDPASKKSNSSPILNSDAGETINPVQTPLNKAMAHGAPSPTDILFTARVLPDSTNTEVIIARANVPNPDGKFKGPYRRFDIDVDAVTRYVTLAPRPDGLRHGEVEFVTYVYDVHGKLINSTGNIVKLEVTPEVYGQLKAAGIQGRLQVSVPAKSESLLRIAIHDIPSGRVGAIEVATSDVIHLPPPPAIPTPSKP